MVMKNFLLGLSKFVLGIILAMLIMSLAGLSMAKYFITKNAEQPDRPTYENDLPEDQPSASGSGSADEGANKGASEGPTVETETPQAKADEPLPDGAYKVAVNQPVGLIVRSGPGGDYENIGGLDYQESVTVLSEEGGWLKIALGNGEEGWIKDGNVDRE
ncbi:MAG: SH3 domain-containing protein [Phormidesmis priestleyi]|uniref:SH3 domain-containing protein n=1 Tax=Phormidesmis priestleyi TaxID=268141 RepID=A0A2W4ZUQ9_9CYAN|nr:MAG: SH3 domain-containing protein [Phormidesmis priestleyi]